MMLRDKVAWITGGGSGIGRATALRFAEAGARVALFGRSIEKLRAVEDTIKTRGAEALAVEGDLREADQMERAANKIVERWNRLDVVIANAGINGVWAPLDELSPDDWDETLDTNLRGSFLTLKYAVPHMKERGGSIVLTSSVNGTRIFSNAGATAYSCSKAGQVALAKMAALELAKFRIRVNVICPGEIDTDIETEAVDTDRARSKLPVEFPEGRIPLTGGRAGTPEQVAELMLFLASDASSHITGTEIWIDGGESLLQG